MISRTSTQHYKSAPENLPEIARQLGVANIVEGSVQKSGDAVRVNVQLIKAADDSHLWADTFDRKLTDIFSVESEVAKAIADQLRAKLTGQEEQVIATKPTDNLEAYDAYLRGLADTLKTTYTSTNAVAAQKYLRQAVRLDPKFALAWALLSYADSAGYITRAFNLRSPSVKRRGRPPQLRSLFSRISARPFMAKGFYHYAFLKDYDSAVRYYEQARQFLPNSSRNPEALAYVQRRRGHGTGASPTSTKPSGSTRATFLSLPNMRFLISTFAVSQKHYESSIWFSISRQTTRNLGLKAGMRKPRAICRGLLRSSLRSARRPRIPRVGNPSLPGDPGASSGTNHPSPKRDTGQSRSNPGLYHW